MFSCMLLLPFSASFVYYSLVSFSLFSASYSASLLMFLYLLYCLSLNLFFSSRPSYLNFLSTFLFTYFPLHFVLLISISFSTVPFTYFPLRVVLLISISLSTVPFTYFPLRVVLLISISLSTVPFTYFPLRVVLLISIFLFSFLFTSLSFRVSSFSSHLS
jgi:hypothetical protein